MGSPTEAATAPPAPASKRAVFLRRSLSFVVLWTLVITTLFVANRYVSGFCFLGVMLTLAGLGLSEFYALVARRGFCCFRDWGIVGGLLLMGSTFVYLSGALGTQAAPAKANDFETSFLILFVLGLCLRQFVAHTQDSGILAISTTLLGLMYVPWLLNFIQKIRFFPAADGRVYLIYFLVVTKFSDTGAYLTGSLLGRHKMIPRISPGKTWEGFAGAILFSTLASLGLAYGFGERLRGMTPFHAVVLGIVLSVAAVVGDLIESLFKREAGLKDSGRSLPGIGGVLDLLDSLLFNAPLMYLYLRHVLTP